MRVVQAVYGEIPGRGHGLRASSSDALIATAIASKLDLPDAVPRGIQAWSPFVRGFPFGEHYVLARTFLDSSASRGGMVITHALIVSLDEMCEVESLATLFGLLAPSLIECPSSMATLELDIAYSPLTPAADLIGTANALTAQGPPPVVRLGVEGFEHLADSLWRNLWPALRRNFAFRLSFGPNDVVEQPAPALVCTPEQLQARWPKHRVVKPDDQTSKSPSAEVLCGQRDVQPILAIAEQLGLEVSTLNELSKLERLHTLIHGGEHFDDLLAALRLTDGLSNQTTLGASIKDDLIGRLTALIPSVGCKQLLPMRNLTLSGFANTRSLWSAVESLVSNLEFAPEDDIELMEMLAASVDENIALPQWRAAVSAGLSSAASQDKPHIFQAIWRWSEHDQVAFGAAVDILPAGAAIEHRLAQAVPKRLYVTSLVRLLSPLLKKRWLVAHGAVLAATLPPLDATYQQLDVDKDPDHGIGLRSALRYASPEQTLKCALVHKDLRLVELSAELAAANPQLLSDINCADITEQKVWGAAIGKNFSLWNAPNNPISVRDTVLAQLAEGKPVDISLLEALAYTPLADLSAISERAGLWSLLPVSQLDRYLEATATGWLELAVRGAEVHPPDKELERAIRLNSRLQSVLEDAAVTVQVRLSIVSALTLFREDTFITFLKNLLRSVPALSHKDSERLGTLLAFRRWDRAAKYLSDCLAEDRQDLMPGLRLCTGLLDFFTCWRREISKPSAAEKWSAFEEEARELYPDGPDSRELWSRAGGRNSDLPGGSLDGATRWHKTINLIRYGGRPNRRALLEVMCQDFPSNEKLLLYINDTDIIG